MSAIYHPDEWESIYNAAFNIVVTYIQSHPGESIEAISTATNQTYAVIYAIAQAAGMIILPNTPGELNFHAHGHQ